MKVTYTRKGDYLLWRDKKREVEKRERENRRWLQKRNEASRSEAQNAWKR